MVTSYDEAIAQLSHTRNIAKAYLRRLSIASRITPERLVDDLHLGKRRNPATARNIFYHAVAAGRRIVEEVWHQTLMPLARRERQVLIIRRLLELASRTS